VLAGLISYFRYLKVGLSAVLIFIGIKMLIDPGDSPPRWWFQVDIATSTSLIVVASIILLSMIASVISAQREKRRQNKPPKDKKQSPDDNPHNESD
jgi:tellurite resistance protein TerC